MASDALAREIRAYELMLPEVRAQHGSGWALVVGEKLQGVFRSFDAAARWATERFENRQVLIRHTSEHQPSFTFRVVDE